MTTAPAPPLAAEPLPAVADEAEVGLRSGMLLGQVVHARRTPTRHHFRYSLCGFLVDLDELGTLSRWWPWFGVERRALWSLWRSDYLRPRPTRGGEPTRKPATIGAEWAGEVRSLLGTPTGRVQLLTMPRLCGYAFNPVSFYFVDDASGGPLGTVAEVNNTFGERHFYVLTAAGEDATAGANASGSHYRHPKEFYVSPFYDRRGEYRFAVRRTRDRVDVRVDLYHDEIPTLRTRWFGPLVPLSAGRLARALSDYPAIAFRTMPRILVEAAKLKFLRGLAVQTKPAPASPRTIQVYDPSARTRWFQRLIRGRLARLEEGALEVTWPDGSQETFGSEATPSPGDKRADIHFRDWQALGKVVLGGEIGFGEAHTAGLWTSSDTVALLRLILANYERLDPPGAPQRWLAATWNAWLHRLRPNSRSGSKRNIQAHYDLSNDLFRTFLDDTMTYSSGILPRGGLHGDATSGEVLAVAQHEKIRRVLDLARVGPDDHLLEIGSGWGALALEAAGTRGARVTTVTLSEEQFETVRERARTAGLAGRIDVRLQDYRDLTGSFDKIVSVEMLEAVGHRYLPAFFEACDRLLAPNGLVALQVITIPDAFYDSYRKSSDWIRKYIFPGGHLPSLHALTGAMRRTNLMVESLENIGPHYARTLRLWRERFERSTSELEALGFDESFRRIWTYYFCHCEAAFAERMLNTLQLSLTRPGNRTLVALDERYF